MIDSELAPVHTPSVDPEGLSQMTEFLAYTPDQVCTLTGLTRHQLRYWDDTDFFSPEQEDPASRFYGKLYSFRDLVGLRAIALLRTQVSLQELRRLGEWLMQRFDSPWSSIKFWVVGSEVVFKDPLTGAALSTRPLGQRTWTYELYEIATSMREATSESMQRGESEVGKISQHRYTVRNAHVLAGTRIPTKAVWNLHDAGYSVDRIIQEYPRLSAADVETALDFEASKRKRESG
jgi:DNA-binding transcriptional MerR regulator